MSRRKRKLYTCAVLVLGWLANLGTAAVLASGAGTVTWSVIVHIYSSILFWIALFLTSEVSW